MCLLKICNVLFVHNIHFSLLQTVVNLYLLEGIPLIAKHTAVLYLLFDLMHLEENTDLVSAAMGLSFVSYQINFSSRIVTKNNHSVQFL